MKSLLRKLIPIEYFKLYALLNPSERFKALILFIMMLISSVLEVAGVGMIPVFVSIVADPERVLNIEALAGLYSFLRIESAYDLLARGALILILVFLLKSSYQLFFTYIKSKFIFNRRYTLSHRMMQSYMQAPYTFHLGRNTAELLRNTTQEVNILVNQVLTSLLELSKEVIMVIALLTFLLMIEPLITLVTFFVLGAVTASFLALTQRKVKSLGKQEQVYRRTMIKAVNQGLGGFKDARILNRESNFIDKYKKMAFHSSRLMIMKNFIQQIPKPMIETLAVSGMMLIAMMMVWQGRPMSAIIPVLTLFGAATIRLMPSIQAITKLITIMRYANVSVNPIYDDIKELEASNRAFRIERKNSKRLNLSQKITFENIHYRYPNSEAQALLGVDIEIKNGQSVAFVGSSGAGKTTLADVLLGLLEPQEGKVLVDGRDIKVDISAWQRNIGYIPQFIYLSDESLRENIAFGLGKKNTDEEKLWKAVKMAQLEELISELPQGIDTIVGERGTRLSGGQRQRVGIARALYHDPQVLVMDEATSALDNITEKYIINAIEKLKGERSVIMIAHRLTTVRKCDVIFMMKGGKVIAKGSYDELMTNSKQFREMAMES